MSNGAMPQQQYYDVVVTTQIGYGDRQRIAMGWQQTRTLKIKQVPAWTQQEADAKVLAKFGTGWKLG